MTAATRRLLICLSLAVAAHAALFAAMAGTGLIATATQHTLTVTLSTQTTAADLANPVFSPVLAARTQRGSDNRSRLAQAAADTISGKQTIAGRTQPQQPADRAATHLQRPATAAQQRLTSPRPTKPAHAQAKQPRAAQSRHTRSAHSDPRATYLATWRRRVEQHGNRHYPAALIATAPRKRLTLGVTLRADGRLHSVRILASSGSTALDQAAMAIVRNAAPYAPLPASLRAQNQSLTFAYDWLFGSRGER